MANVTSTAHDLSALRSGPTRWIGAWAVGALAVTIVTDQLRLILSEQPAAASTATLGVAVVGALHGLATGRAKVPPVLGGALIGYAALIVGGGIVALLRGLPVSQIVAGAVTTASLVPAVVLGLAVGREPPAVHRRLYYVVAGVVVLCCLVAFLQQFGYLSVEATLEGTSQRRADAAGNLFRYTTGPFRTASVFSMFLASAVCLVLAAYERTSSRDDVVAVVTVALALVAMVLTARRSGLVMLVGVVGPVAYRMLTGRATRTMVGLGVAVLVAGAFLSGAEEEVAVELEAKLAHSTVESDAPARLANALSLDDRDIELLSVLGDGLGSHGPAVRAAGLHAEAHEELLLEMHPVIHFGWFKDLLMFGPIGLLAHLFAFVSLLRATIPSPSSPPRPGSGAATGLVLAAAAVYFFVATSWLQGLTGGPLFGLAVGYGIGRANAPGKH